MFKKLKQKNKKVYPPNRRGITFVETIINIYIYTLLITVCTSVAIVFIKNRIVIRQKQQAVEELSIVINEMGKKIRMSECNFKDYAGCVGGSNLHIIHNNGDKIDYYLDNTSKNLEINGVLMFDNVDGAFYITRGEEDEIPLITIKLWKLDKEDNLINGTIVKTSVSMRSGYKM